MNNNLFFFIFLLMFEIVIIVFFRKTINNYYKFLSGKIKFKELHLEDAENQRTLYMIFFAIVGIFLSIYVLINKLY